MVCPKCGSYSRACIDSRPAPGNQTRRKHKCLDCGYRWITYERISGSAEIEKEKERNYKRAMLLLCEVFALLQKGTVNDEIGCR